MDLFIIIYDLIVKTMQLLRKFLNYAIDYTNLNL